MTTSNLWASGLRAYCETLIRRASVFSPLTPAKLFRPPSWLVSAFQARGAIEPPTPAFSGPPADWPKGFEISAYC